MGHARTNHRDADREATCQNPRTRLRLFVGYSIVVWRRRSSERDRLRDALEARGVETAIHYPSPPHLSGAYSDLGWRRGDLPVTERLADTVLSLPMGPHLDRAGVEQVIEAARAAEADDE